MVINQKTLLLKNGIPNIIITQKNNLQLLK
jgi:hypothetical protein